MARPYSVCLCAAALLTLAAPLTMAQTAANVATKPLAANAPPKPAPSPISYGQTTAQRRIESVLNSPLKAPLQFVETPLSMVARELSESYDIPIIFDDAALKAAGASPESEVSVSIAHTNLKPALRLTLANAFDDMTYIVAEDVVLITTQDAARNHLERRIYPVDKLIAAFRAGRPSSSPSQKEQVEVDDLAELADALALTISPQTSRRSGAGQGDVQKIAGKYLVVLKTQAVHEEIEDFLKHLAEAAARQ